MARATICLPRLQLDIIKDPHRFKVIDAGRGFAKTGILLADALLNLRNLYYTPDGQKLKNRMMYVAPTIGEARDIAWDRAKELFDPYTVKKPNESRMEIDLKYGAKFFVRGGLKPNTLRGDYLTWLGLDEAAFLEPQGMTPEDMWQKIFRPMLAKVRPSGEATIVSTPDGHDFFYDLWCKAQADDNWIAYQHSSLDGGFVTEEEVMAAKEDMTHEAWRQEFFGEFIASAGRVYYNFDRKKHCKPVSYVPELDIHWSWDFNVNPYVSSTLHHIHKGNVYQFDEICIGETPDNVEEFMKRYPKENIERLCLYGDYFGSVATSGVSDYQQIEQMLMHHGYPKPEIYVAPNPNVRDRTNSVNAMMLNANGQVRYYINPKTCPKTVRDYEQVKRKKTSSKGDIDKTSNPELTHTSDSVGYFMHHHFPAQWRQGKRPPQEKRQTAKVLPGYWI